MTDVADVCRKMFTLLRMYAKDDIASMYATSMHSDSGYLVINASVSASARVEAVQRVVPFDLVSG